MSLIAANASLDGLLVNGRRFNSPVLPAAYAEVLQSPVRISEPATPAPYGHRNNQIHMFDEFGLYLIEHHATRLVNAVIFVLWLDESPHKPAREFAGELTVGGVQFFPGMMVADYRGGDIPFGAPVLSLYSAKRDGVWIGLEFAGLRQRNGCRGKRFRFVNVSVCLS